METLEEKFAQEVKRRNLDKDPQREADFLEKAIIGCVITFVFGCWGLGIYAVYLNDEKQRSRQQARD